MGRERKGFSRKSPAVRLASPKELRKLLGVGGESETGRIVMEDRLLAEKLAAAADRIARRGGLLDVFSRTGPPGLKAKVNPVKTVSVHSRGIVVL